MSSTQLNVSEAGTDAAQGSSSFVSTFPSKYIYSDSSSNAVVGDQHDNIQNDEQSFQPGTLFTPYCYHDSVNKLASNNAPASQLVALCKINENDLNEPKIRDSSLPKGSNKPRILLMGLRRSGKSSIQKVVFHKMSPNETLFLESTNNIIKDDLTDMSFIRFKIWDIPGHIDFFNSDFDLPVLLENTSAIIYVIDAQDDYTEALQKLHVIISESYIFKPSLNYEIFIHKVDCLSDEAKIECQRDITQQVTDNLMNSGVQQVNVGFHLTTIYDHSIFESFSKVVQKLLSHMAAFEDLLNIFIQNSQLEKAFLFDVASKIYLATDCNFVDMQTCELCCDMLDLVVDIASIYNSRTSEHELVDYNYFSEKSAATIKLNDMNILYLRGINRHLALICILRQDAYNKIGVIDYNFQCIKNAFLMILDLSQQSAVD